MVDKESITLAEWLPLVDITEDDKEYLIKAELPEIKKEEIKVTVENGVLVISGERKLEKEEKSARPKQIEVEAATGQRLPPSRPRRGAGISVSSFGQCLNVLGKED